MEDINDILHLDRYRKGIIALEGFGEKSYENLIASINESRNTTFVRFLVAMDIPLIGRTASRILDRHFHSRRFGTSGRGRRLEREPLMV
jgi:DNA ligase (NAD+)